MKITGIETFVVDTGFTPRRPWLFSAVLTIRVERGGGGGGGEGRVAAGAPAWLACRRN